MKQLFSEQHAAYREQHCEFSVLILILKAVFCRYMYWVTVFHFKTDEMCFEMVTGAGYDVNHNDNNGSTSTITILPCIKQFIIIYLSHCCFLLSLCNYSFSTIKVMLSSNDCELWTGKNAIAILEYFKVLCQNFNGRTEKNDENSVMITGNRSRKSNKTYQYSVYSCQPFNSHVWSYNYVNKT